MSSSSPTKSPKSSSDAALAGSYDEEDENPNPLPLSICCKIVFNDGKTRDFNYVLRKKLESYMSATGSMVTLN